MLIQFILIPFFVISQILLYYSIASSKKKLIIIFKPLTTLFIVALVGLSFLNIGIDKRYVLIILIALIFSLFGDIVLIFAVGEQKQIEKFFLIGLSLFFITHIAYVVAFTVFNGFFIQDAILGGVLLIVVIILYQIYTKKGTVGNKIKIPTFIYMLILGFMLTKALSSVQGEYFSDVQKVLIIIGAMMFVASDIILGVRYFIKSRNVLRIILLMLYFNGQYLIALSCYYPN
jgi:uncharacterized membrane protein YhhN